MVKRIRVNASTFRTAKRVVVGLGKSFRQIAIPLLTERKKAVKRRLLSKFILASTKTVLDSFAVAAHPVLGNTRALNRARRKKSDESFSALPD